jgi:hypothetical protein
MATYQTFQQVGIKENISDIIVNLTPTKTPFQSNIGTEKIHNVLFQWQEDSLRTAATNANVEGADPSFITATPTVMRNNVTQILLEAVQVSDTRHGHRVRSRQGNGVPTAEVFFSGQARPRTGSGW